VEIYVRVHPGLEFTPNNLNIFDMCYGRKITL